MQVQVPVDNITSLELGLQVVVSRPSPLFKDLF